MKIIHTGDVHLGAVTKNLPPKQASLRKTELLDNFRALAGYAEREGVKAVLIAGDLFDENKVDKRLKEELFFILKGAKSVGFYYVKGNHDRYIPLDGAPDNLHLFGDKGGKKYHLGENITLYGADNADFSESFFSSLSFQKKEFNILLLHGDISSSEREYIPLSLLKDKGIDYLALGHIHKAMITAEKLDGRGKYRYCGCLEARGFDECGKHGFFLLDIQNGEIQTERFLSFAKREVWEVEADISTAQSYYDVERLVFASLLEVEKENIVKVILTGRHIPELKKDKPLLVERLNEQYFFVRLEDESKLLIELNGLENDRSERGEFIKEVGRCEMNDDLRQEVLEIGLKALSGEEIDL